jgi:hypothetical protein
MMSKIDCTDNLSDIELFEKARQAFVTTRQLFQTGKNRGLFLGNDNLIGDIGEYYVMDYYKNLGLSPELAPKKNSRYDISIPSKNIKVSVKTITDWSEHKKGTQVKPLDKKNNPWNVLAVVQLDSSLMVRMLSIIPLVELLKKPEFLANISNRKKKDTKTFPRVQDWEWLNEYQV